MEASDVRDLVLSAFPDAEVNVEIVGGHYNVTVVCASFEGVRSVARQQKVYAPLMSRIADGSMHAVNVRAMAPSEMEP